MNKTDDHFLKLIDKVPGEYLAVIKNKEEITYQELRNLSNKIAIYLSDYLHFHHRLIGVKMQRDISLVATIYGIIKSGNAYLPLDSSYPEQRLAYMLETSACDVIITDNITKNIDIQGISLLTYDQIVSEVNSLRLTPEFNSDEHTPTYVIFTSGSTGHPKGVEMPFGALNNLIRWQNTQSHPGLTTLQFAPISFDVSFQEIFSTLSSGGTLVLADEEARTNPEKLAEIITNHKVERLILPFIALQLFSSYCVQAEKDFPFLKEVITSGEKLIITSQIRSFFKKNKCLLVNQYGPTESHVVTAYKLLPEDVAIWPEFPPIGSAIDNCKILIMKEGDEMAATNEAGEIYIGGKCLANGYIHQPELTAERFVMFDNERFYKSGDVGKMNEKGEIEFLGRKDEQVKIRGYRIEPAEIEIQLAEAEGVKEAAVKPFISPSGVQMLAAFIVGTPDIDLLKIKAKLSEKLPEYMIPAVMVQVETLPRTPSGKIDKKSLEVPVNKRTLLKTEYTAPKTETERQLAELWKTLLMLDDIGIHDNVFDLGANSLVCIQFSSLFEEMHGKKLPVVKLYQYPAISGQAAFIDNKRQNEIISESEDDKTEKTFTGDIAVIGMSLRVPGASTLEQFWKNLLEGRESISYFNDDQLDPSIPEHLRKHPDYVKARGIIDDAQSFDYEFFGINEMLARLMDPQQRKFLEVAWECIENAGLNIDDIKKNTAVFAGCGNNTYFLNNVLPHSELIEKAGDFQVMTLNEKDYIATKTAFILDLKGVAVSVYTACSTSLTAIVQACESLRAGRCRYALAGGSSITSPVNSGYLYNEGSMLSKDGKCRPFDEEASGTPFSDGVGVVLLKRLDDALKDKDHIYAVIKGTGINNDGGGKSSFTAPSVEGQAGAITMALKDAGIDADTVSYIEAHGTATPIGDPIEMEALNMVYPKRKNNKIRYIGSVKSNFGHLTPAAGVIGLIKTALALKYKQLPPSINFNKPNPAIDFETHGWKVLDSLTDWKKEPVPKRAGVSSFGVGGTNVHVILEEPPELTTDNEQGTYLLLLSAKTESALDRNVQRIRDFIGNAENPPVNHIAYTLAHGRKHFRFRQFFVYDVDFKDAFSEKNLYSSKNHLTEIPQGLVFMFPGQGSQYPGMGKYLYENQDYFKNEFDRCIELAEKYGLPDLKEVIFADHSVEAAEKLKNTRYTQPALFVLEYCLSRLIMNNGIFPGALAGHSIGEFTAACLAGVFSVEDAMKMVISRAMMMEKMPSGLMLSVRSEVSGIEKFLNDKVNLAVVNTSQSVVLSGPKEDISMLAEVMKKEGIACTILQTSHAFHSWMMEPVLDSFRKVVESVSFSIPRIPIVSTVSGTWLSDYQAVNPEYWVRHLRETVQFAGAINTVANEGMYCFVEIGPRNVLSSLVRQQLREPSIPVFSSLGDESGKNEYFSLLKLYGNLWLNGITPDLTKLFPHEKYRKIPLPPYSFEKTYCWLEAVPFKVNKISEPDTEAVLPEIQTEDTQQPDMEDFVRNILEESSGISLKGFYRQTAFTDIGLDSLFLTQIALSIQKKTGIKVTFRQLNEELGSIGGLTDYLKEKMAAVKPVVQKEGVADIKISAEKEERKPFGAIARIETKKVTAIPASIEKFLTGFIEKYNAKTRLSKEYTQKFRKYLADPRVVTGFKPHIKEIVYQVVVKRSKGCRLYDLDGNEYIDILNGFGSNFFGYAHPEITRSIRKIARNGYEIGPQHHLAGEVAKMICELTGNERAALCNTGSEAVLGVLRIARTVTGKNKVVMFNGSYHGINDEVIVRGGKELHSYPAAPGVPPEAVQNAVVLDYGEQQSLQTIAGMADEVAAVLVEPVQSRRPEFQPFEFLKELRKICDEMGIVLIFDEVITGFRSNPAGIQGITGIRADLVTYGKVPGGGMPIGIMSGKAEMMDALDGGFWTFGDDSKPEKGVTYFAGTFVRHPLTLAAAYSSLTYLKKGGPALQESLNKLTKRLADELNLMLKRKSIPLKINYFSSLFRPVFTEELPFTELLYPLLRFHGVHILEGFPCFLTLAHHEKDIDKIISAFDLSLDEMLKAGIFEQKASDKRFLGEPPVPGARLGKDPEGNPGWYIPDPEKPGSFLKLV